MDHLSKQILARWFVRMLILAGLAIATVMMAQDAQGATVAEGEVIYPGTCSGCHGADGSRNGVSGTCPTVIESEFPFLAPFWRSAG